MAYKQTFIRTFKCICCQRRYYLSFQNCQFKKYKAKNKLCRKCNFIKENNEYKSYKILNIKDVNYGK